ncbi:MAG: alkaline phosphatase family protein [Erysipelotrichaceae bacterium]|nr:alkaline phosphatase family protein [Erysipelotrichaceae bacterium]
MNKLVVFCLDALCTLDLEYMKTLPNFRMMFEKGSLVKHVEPVYPTLTYPCHCSILTGVSTKVHGVPHNEIVDVEDPQAPWYSLRSQIKCRTFMDVCKENGLTTCSLTWPVSGGANIDYNMPMIVPINYQGDDPYQFYVNHSTQELLDRYYWKYSHYLIGEGKNLDEFTMHLALDIIEDYQQPDVMLVKMCDLDTVKHCEGIDNDLVKQQLRKHDTQFGLLVEAIKRFGDYENTTFVILGDHGQQNIERHINFNLLLKEHGFIQTDDQNRLVDWQAYCHSASMSGWIELKDPNDQELRQRVYDFLISVKDDPKYNIGYVFTKEEADERFGLKSDHIDFVIEGKLPMSFDSTLAGKDLFEKYLKPGWHHSLASHGYLPFRDETTAFIACGKHVKEGVVIERGSMLNEAVTMAHLLGIEMDGTEGVPWTEMIQ